jgi:hypothetical protein
MPRNMSFALTTEACRNFEKTVTRRNGWWDLKTGEILQQVEKGMGLRKGEKIQKIHPIQIIDCRSEPINELVLLEKPDYGPREMILEGFPGRDPMDFVNMYCEHNKCHNREIVNRIEFRYYLTGPSAEQIQIPERIATCPSCKAPLIINPDGWQLLEDGTMICDSFTSSCATEPDMEAIKQYREFEDIHRAGFEMPYVYWLPIDSRIEIWLNATFRFEL